LSGVPQKKETNGKDGVFTDEGHNHLWGSGTGEKKAGGGGVDRMRGEWEEILK